MKAVHPSVYVLEEMEARGWDRDLLAWFMVLGTDKPEALDRLRRDAEGYAEQGEQWQRTRLALDIYFEVGPTDRHLHLGKMAQDLSAAFGASDSLFENLERAWLAPDHSPEHP